MGVVGVGTPKSCNAVYNCDSVACGGSPTRPLNPPHSPISPYFSYGGGEAAKKSLAGVPRHGEASAGVPVCVALICSFKFTV